VNSVSIKKEVDEMKKYSALFVLLSMAVAVLSGCRDKVGSGVHEVKRAQVSGIGLQTVVLAPFDVYYETSGTVRAKTVSMVASRIMGTIISVKVNEGDRVGAGQLLLTIDDSDMALKVKGASEGYNEASKALEAAKENKTLQEITLQRYKKLYDEKALSRQELDQIETRKKVADLDYDRARSAVSRVEAGVNEAKVYQGYARVKAPVSGMVTGKKAEIGSMAVPGMPLLTIEDTSSYRIEVNVDETMSGKIKPGMEVKVGIDALHREIKGVVTDIVQAIDPLSRSFLVKISLKAEGPGDKEIRSGLYARVNMPVGRKEILVVPKSALVEKGQLTGIYTVSAANLITYQLVRTGKSRGENVEVLSGLNPGDTIIVSGIDRAVDGGMAVIQQQPAK
jgi:RND family efflux transporter MFP subunit